MGRKAKLKILATAGALSSSTLPQSLHCCSVTLSAVACSRSCSKICCPTKIENKQTLKPKPALLVCKHINRSTAARQEVSSTQAASPCFPVTRWCWACWSAGAQAEQAPKVSLWDIFCVRDSGQNF